MFKTIDIVLWLAMIVCIWLGPAIVIKIALTLVIIYMLFLTNFISKYMGMMGRKTPYSHL